MPPTSTSPVAAPAAPLAIAPAALRPADRFMRRLLRVDSARRPVDAASAQRAMSRSLWLSAARCTLTYLVVPLAGSLLPFGVVHGYLAIALGLAAAVCSVQSTRRFWIAGHRKRWHYTGFAAVVLTLLGVGVGVDAAGLF